MPDIKEIAKLVRDEPRTRCEQPMEKAVYCSRTRTSVCRAVGNAVAVGSEERYDLRAVVGDMFVDNDA